MIPLRPLVPALLATGLAGLAGCAAPVPCAVANDALVVGRVEQGAEGFQVTIANGAAQPLTEKVFIEVAVVQAGRPVLAGSTATTATWPAGASRDLLVPYAIDTGLDAGPYETVTHFKCLSQ